MITTTTRTRDTVVQATGSHLADRDKAPRFAERVGRPPPVSSVAVWRRKRDEMTIMSMSSSLLRSSIISPSSRRTFLPEMTLSRVVLARTRPQDFGVLLSSRANDQIVEINGFAILAKSNRVFSGRNAENRFSSRLARPLRKSKNVSTKCTFSQTKQEKNTSLQNQR